MKSDKDKFAGLKRKMVAANEVKYCQEARTRWGDQAVERSIQRIMEMSEAKLQESQYLAKAICKTLCCHGERGRPGVKLPRGGRVTPPTADVHLGELQDAHRGLAYYMWMMSGV